MREETLISKCVFLKQQQSVINLESYEANMANRLLRCGLRRATLTPLLHHLSLHTPPNPSIPTNSRSTLPPFRASIRPIARHPWWVFRDFSHGHVNLVISEGKPKFETHEVEAPKKEKWKTKKRLKQQRKREKKKRRAANKRDPRHLGVKGRKRKQKFESPEERIKSKIEKVLASSELLSLYPDVDTEGYNDQTYRIQAKIKEALLIERLKRYEVPKLQGPEVKPETLTGEERFYMKKMAQKGSNYVPVGRRGVFGGVILNMHLHWKKHETVKVICKPCKPGQVQEYAKEIARLSGGTPIQIIGKDTIVFYRGKDYVQPEVMSPIDTLTKKRALEKSKYEQSLDSVRRFIGIAEKELELYYRHVALYGDPHTRSSDIMFANGRKSFNKPEIIAEKSLSPTDYGSDVSEMDLNSTDQEASETEGDYSDEQDLSGSGVDENFSGSDLEDGGMLCDEDGYRNDAIYNPCKRVDPSFRASSGVQGQCDFDDQDLKGCKFVSFDH
ncbi:hypothetical protein Scep_015665 [Stephania cephalantha]|uniref:CRM domain-containing protein n=1 Tax=Stephania cephalantha TaxID=152367 RepID=A0AAP0P1P0_9MAGN